ncbi:MAG TPA: LuxR C-terminal-related transcriptional regulator [Rhodopila sp.]|nr:LuxR C-terminal-related transcriptional regulator [Rhodopila sp.]
MAFEEIRKSEIFNDFYRPMGLGYGAAVLPFNGAARHGVLSAHRGLRAENFSAAAVTLLRQVSPHVRRALQLQRQIARANAVAGGLSVALDHFRMAVILLDRQGIVIEFNAAAKALLDTPGCPLRLVAGRLTAVTSTNAADLSRAIAGVRTRSAEVAPPAVLRLPKPSGGVIGILVTPARGAIGVAYSSDGMVLLFISDPGQAQPSAPDWLMGQFGLSRTEADVAVRLFDGGRIEDIADARRVSQETVRVQVKHVLAKTDTRSQGQLIGLLSRSLGALRGSRR